MIFSGRAGLCWTRWKPRISWAWFLWSSSVSLFTRWQSGRRRSPSSLWCSPQFTAHWEWHMPLSDYTFHCWHVQTPLKGSKRSESCDSDARFNFLKLFISVELDKNVLLDQNDRFVDISGFVWGWFVGYEYLGTQLFFTLLNIDYEYKCLFFHVFCSLNLPITCSVFCYFC